MKKCVKTQPLIIAHRGLHDHYPENSLQSIQAAERAGITAAEFDIRQTRDARFVLSHDAALPGTERPIAECALAELQRIVPNPITLDDVLAKTSSPFHFCIEVTDEDIDVRRLRILLHETGAEKRSTILSFYPNILQETELRSFPRWLLVDIPSGSHFFPEVFRDPIVFSISLKVQAVAPHHILVDQAFMKKAKEHNLLVVPWVVNNKQRAKELVALNVDGLTTDIPAQLQAII